MFWWTFDDNNIGIWLSITENIALNKQALQFNPFVGFRETTSTRAVDGQKSDLSIHGGQCTETYTRQLRAEWRVDLDGVIGIHHIYIQYRTDNLLWGMVLKIIQIYTNKIIINNYRHINLSVKAHYCIIFKKKYSKRQR